MNPHDTQHTRRPGRLSVRALAPLAALLLMTALGTARALPPPREPVVTATTITYYKPFLVSQSFDQEKLEKMVQWGRLPHIHAKTGDFDLFEEPTVNIHTYPDGRMQYAPYFRTPLAGGNAPDGWPNWSTEEGDDVDYGGNRYGNTTAMWSSLDHNLKFWPLAIRHSFQPKPTSAALVDMKVTLVSSGKCDGAEPRGYDVHVRCAMDTWVGLAFNQQRRSLIMIPGQKPNWNQISDKKNRHNHGCYDHGAGTVSRYDYTTESCTWAGATTHTVPDQDLGVLSGVGSETLDFGSFAQFKTPPSEADHWDYLYTTDWDNVRYRVTLEGYIAYTQPLVPPTVPIYFVPLGDDPLVIDQGASLVDPRVGVTSKYEYDEWVALGSPRGTLSELAEMGIRMNYSAWNGDASTVDTTRVGTYTLAYAYNDTNDNLVDIYQREVIVQGPVYELQESTVSMDAGQAFSDPGVRVTDYPPTGYQRSLSGDVSNLDTSLPGSYTVPYYDTDYTGTTVLVAERDVVVRGSYELVSPAPVLWPGTTYVDAGVKVVDPQGNVVRTIMGDASNLNTAVPGEYTVPYNVTLPDGSTRTVAEDVVVVPKLANVQSGYYALQSYDGRLVTVQGDGSLFADGAGTRFYVGNRNDGTYAIQGNSTWLNANADGFRSSAPNGDNAPQHFFLADAGDGKVGIRSKSGYWLFTDDNIGGQLSQNVNKIDDWWPFTLVGPLADVESGYYTLQAHDGRPVTVGPDGSLFAIETEGAFYSKVADGPGTRFYVGNRNDGTYAIQGGSAWLNADANGLRSSAPNGDFAEQHFMLFSQDDGRVGIRTKAGAWLFTDDNIGGQLSQNENQIYDWWPFTLVPSP